MTCLSKSPDFVSTADRPNETDSHASNRPLPRRRFLQSAWALGALGTFAPALRAATTGRVLLGFQVPASYAVMLGAILTTTRSRYQPDLGAKPVLLLGGSGTLSVDAILKAPRDGSTALIAPSAFLTLLPEIRKLADDPIRRLVPVAGIGETTVAFIVGPSVPSSIRTMSAYFDWVRENPLMGSYAVPGLGTAMHFVGREVTRSSQVALKVVHYRGPQPMFEDIVSGAIPAAFTVVPDLDFAAQNPAVRILGVASGERWPTCPEVPTFMELQLMQAPALESLGFHFLEGTPVEKIDELAAAVRAATATPEVLKMMRGISMRPMSITNKTYAEVLAAERITWLDLARRVDGGSVA